MARTTRRSCAECDARLGPPARLYCSAACTREARNARRRRPTSVRRCAWCEHVVRARRKGTRYCSARCRVAAHRAAVREHPAGFLARQTMRRFTRANDPDGGHAPRAVTWLEVHCDAGFERETAWGAYVARLRVPGGAWEDLAVGRGRLPDGLPGPTPAEGIAAIAALRWIEAAMDAGVVDATCPVVLCIDSAPVAAKVRSGNSQGESAEIWTALAAAGARLRTN